MKEEKKYKTQRAASIVKEWRKTYSLEDFPVVEREAEECAKRSSEISPTMLKVLFVCCSFTQNEEHSNQLLINMIPEAGMEELMEIFSKITSFSDEFLEYCKEYCQVKKLRNIISKIFRKHKITCPEAHVYHFDRMDERQKKHCISGLFGTINSPEFKNSKEAIASVIEQYSFLLPNLTERGYRNVLRIGKIHIFANSFSPFHPSEVIRLEYFKTITCFPDFYQFLYFNQFIAEPETVREVKRVFLEKLEGFKQEKVVFPIYIDLLYNGLIKRMCRAENLQRRHLGVVLLSVIFKYEPTILEPRLVMSLIYDLSTDIRKLSSAFRDLVTPDIQYHLGNLASLESHKVQGASIFLQDTRPMDIFSRLLLAIDTSNDDFIYGLLYCLNHMKYDSNEYSLIVHSLYEKHSKLSENAIEDGSSASWHILRECCRYFKRVGRNDLLMECMLHSDHLGLICFIKEIADTSNLDPKVYISKGISKIIKKRTNTRKSGGLSQYFVILGNSKFGDEDAISNYSLIKQALFDLIAVTDEQFIVLKDVDENVIFHTLNVFISLFDGYSTDHSFYVRLAFSCLDHASFSIKNCGFALLHLLFRKVLAAQKFFDVFFLTRKLIRMHLSKLLQLSIDKKNEYAVFFILFIFQNMKMLSRAEKTLVGKCACIGGLVGLKAQTILNGLGFPSRLEIQPLKLEFSLGRPEPDILANILVYLNLEDSRIKKLLYERYSFQDASFPYLIHQTVRFIKKIGLCEAVKTRLLDYKANTQHKLHSEKFYIPELDLDYILEQL